MNEPITSPIASPEITLPKLVDGRRVMTQIWDTAGQERFKTVSAAYYRKAQGALVVFDITKAATFDSCKQWLHDVRGQSENVSVTLVGNKSDLRNLREVSTESARKFAEENHLTFIETSALDSSNVEKAFTQAVTKIYRSGMGNVSNSGSSGISLSSTSVSQPEKKKSCCRSA
ncbi:Ras family protein [Oesophagostomum dentatum]|uniref:Ras family protein n=1 Tax=Oesophagostomum dentatum TaxID=61180 RepID=A0A0B1TIG1_OESDE|nr:Ras family protein [Oesophagostomum dentatum]